MTEVLSTRALSFSAGRATLVDEIDLVVGTGELVAVVGPNGAGKSTLLRLLGGDLQPTRGEIRIDGCPLSRFEPARLALRRAVLGQHAAADVPFSVEAVVTMGRYPHRHSEGNSAEADRLAVADSMRRSDVTHLAGRTFATLSGGEQTRTSLARIFAQEADLLILDEPTTALDVAHQENIMGELAQLAREGRTVVAVLHDLNAAAHYATRVLLMADGRIRGDDTPRNIFTEQMLSDVYSQPMRVVEHPFRECPLVLVDTVG